MKYYSETKRNNTCNNMDDSQKHFVKGKQTDTKPYMLHDTI